MIKNSLDQRMEDDSTILRNIEKNNQKISSFIFWLFSDSISITNSQKIGFLFTVLTFVVILSPIASAPSDPYHLQDFSEKLHHFLLFFEDMFNVNGHNYSDDLSYDYEVIDGVQYRVLFSGKLDAKNPDGGRYLMPGINDIITSQKF